jgi:hypothetical protein
VPKVSVHKKPGYKLILKKTGLSECTIRETDKTHPRQMFMRDQYPNRIRTDTTELQQRASKSNIPGFKVIAYTESGVHF